jgi:hypothetical protein
MIAGKEIENLGRLGLTDRPFETLELLPDSARFLEKLLHLCNGMQFLSR